MKFLKDFFFKENFYSLKRNFLYKDHRYQPVKDNVLKILFALISLILATIGLVICFFDTEKSHFF